MRKLVFVMLFMFCATLAVPAAAYQIDIRDQGKFIKSVVFAVNTDEYWVTTADGQTTRHEMDAAAFLENSRTYVPVRYLGYALGVAENDVGWEPATQNVTLRLGANVLGMQIGSRMRVINGRTDEMDVVPVLKERPAWRTYLPARFVAEGLGFQVDWDASDQLVLIWPAGRPKPEIPAQVRQEVRVERQEVVWEKVQNVYLPSPDSFGVKRLSDVYYVLNNGLRIRKPREPNKWCMIYVPNRKPLELKGDMRAYDDLYEILYRSFGDAKLAQEIVTYVKENKPDWRTEIPEKKWLLPDGREIWVTDEGMHSLVEFKIV